MKKVILFDFGGTLDTDGIHWGEKFYDIYNHFHFNLSKEIIREAFVYTEKKLSNIIEPNFSLSKTLRLKIELHLEYFIKCFYLSDSYYLIINELTEYTYNSVIETVKTSSKILDLLNSKHSLGLVSNYYGNIATILDELKLKKYFSSIVDSAVVGIRKPDPKIYEYALNELGVKPNEAIVIGDSYEKDIKPPKLLGCSTIWINRKGWNETVDNDSADFIISSIKELPDTIKKIT